MKKRSFITTNTEIYEKLTLLNFNNRVFIASSKQNQIENIVKNINKKGKCLKLIKSGNYHIVEKILNNINIFGYLNKKLKK